MEGNTKVKYMFAILDRFNRDSVYKSLDVELDFERYAQEFCILLEETLEKMTSSQLTSCELQFDDYAKTIENSADIQIKPRHRRMLKKLHTSKAVEIDGKCSLLFSACSQAIPSDKTERRSLRKIIETLIEQCPEMIKHPFYLNEDERSGPTPLHLMVVKEATTKVEKEFKHGIIEKMLDSITSLRDDLDLNKFNIKGDMARGSLLRGKTLLNIAARTLDTKTIELLLDSVNSPLCFDSYNENKDNMYHSLIRYTASFPEKERDVISVMRKIEGILKKKTKSIDPRKRNRPDSLWAMKNMDNLTPLQLAAKLGRFELFNHILNRKVYRLNVGDRGHFDDNCYDVTEIETIPVSTESTNPTKEEIKEGISRDRRCHLSAIHLLENFVSNETSARFVSINVISKLITSKWNAYKIWVLIWALIHLIVMILFSWQAVVRSRLRNPISSESRSIPEYDNWALVISANSITVLYGIVCLFLQCLYYYFYRSTYEKKKFLLPTYAHVFFLFSVCVIFDFFLKLFEATYDNFILPFILILGWYLLIFFLHAIEHLSFFTILIKDVVKHLIQFGCVLSTLLVGFSTAMFVVMQNTEDTEEDTFENIEKTMVKMFTIMLGLGDLDVLFKSRQPVLAVTVFALFVLLTTILLLNALIAIMSNTCSSLTADASKKAYVRLQRMYTIIHLESMLPNRFLFSPTEKLSRISHNKPGEIIERRILSLRPEDEENLQSPDSLEDNTARKILNYLASYADKSNKSRKTRPELIGSRQNGTRPKTPQLTTGSLQGTVEIYETNNILL